MSLETTPGTNLNSLSLTKSNGTNKPSQQLAETEPLPQLTHTMIQFTVETEKVLIPGITKAWLDILV